MDADAYLVFCLDRHGKRTHRRMYDVRKARGGNEAI